MQLNKGERIRQLGTPRVEDEIGQRQTGREGVQRGHHLRPTDDATGSAREDVILDGVCEAVEKEIDAQQEHAPHDILLGVAAAGLAGRLGGSRVQGEDGNASSDKGHDSVLVDWVFPAEEGHVQEHDGEEFAGFGEDVGDVVNVAETGVAEGRGEGLSDRDKQETEGDGEGGEDAGGGVRRGIGVAEVDVAGEGGEKGLDGVEDEGGAEDDFVGAIGGGGDALLEEGPCQTVCVGGSG